MPLLTRMIAAPLHVDIGPGAVAQLAPLLADRRISAGGHVAVVVGPGLGEEIAETLRPGSANADVLHARRRRVDEAERAGQAAARRLLRRAGRDRRRAHAGRGQVRRDAHRPADGRRRHEPRPRRHRLAGRLAGGGGPQGLLRRADADRARRRPRLRAPLGAADAALGDRRRGHQPSRDRRLAARRARARRAGRRAGGHVRAARPRSRSCTARTGSTTRTSSSRSPRRSCSPGWRWPPPASSRPCSGGDHEILHAVDQLFPGSARHGELAGAARCSPPSCAATTTGRRGRRLPAPPRAAAAARRPRPDRGAVRRGGARPRPAPGPTATRSSSTSSSTSTEVSERVRAFARRLRSLSCGRRRSRRRSSRATAASTGPGGSTCAASRPTLTRLLLPTRVSPDAVTWLMFAVGLAAAAVLTLPGGRRRSRRFC